MGVSWNPHYVYLYTTSNKVNEMKAKKQTIVNNVEQVDKDTVKMDTVSLKEMVDNFRKFLKSNYRNIPNKGSRNYAEFLLNSTQYTHHIVVVSTALFDQGIIDSDPHGFLVSNVTSFDRYNDVINTVLIPAAFDLIKKEHEEKIKKDEEAGNTVSDIEKELNPSNVAAIVSEPTEDTNTDVVDVITTSNRRWVFDKVNYTLSFKTKNGIKTINIVKKGTWRASVIDFLGKCVKFVVDTYKSFKDRLIGIKQTILFKKAQYEYERKQKAAEKAKKKTEDKDDDSLFDDLPDTV